MVCFALLAMAGTVVALPLNINLGAYSPALVVGDGEISFGGKEDVANLMNVLEGAAVNTAATVAAKADTAAAAAAGTTSTAAGIKATDAAVVAAAAAASDAQLQEQAQQIAHLQGLGNKDIAPRIDGNDSDDTAPKAKRDLAGFDRALTFAEAALVKGPKIQLGTGKEGSGVGIIVDKGTPAAAPAAAAGAKRDLLDGLQAATEEVADTARDALDAAGAAADTAVEAVTGQPGVVTDTAAALVDAATGAAGAVADAAQGASPTASAAAAGAKRDLLDALQTAAEGVADTARDALDAAGAAVDTAVEAVTGQPGVVTDTAAALVDAATGAAGTVEGAVADAAAAAGLKRVRTKVTTMYVHAGLPAALRRKRDQTRAGATVMVPQGTGPFDAVNLNVNGDRGLTMTFVETVEEGEDD